MNNFYSQIKSLLLILLFTVIASFNPLKAQQTFLEVPIKLDVEKGSLDDVVVKVRKDGKDAFTQSGAGKMRLKLDFSRKYTLIFTKEGYVTKTIEINTSAPAARITQGFEPYKIGVKLFKQGEENTVVYNQPVAKIKYDQMLDEFNFDTDYSKSILSAMNGSDDKKEETPAPPKEEQKPAPKAEVKNDTPPFAVTPAPKQEEAPPVKVIYPTSTQEEKPAATQSVASADKVPGPALANTPKPASEIETKTAAPTEGEDNQVAKVNSGGDDKIVANSVSSGDEKTKTAAPVVEEEKKRTPSPHSGNDERNKRASVAAFAEKPVAKTSVSQGEEIQKSEKNPSTDTDIQNTPTAYLESEKITREDIIEKNRVITKVRVMKGQQMVEYSRVNYSWGGQYFFKNNCTSIPENLFVSWTGVNN